jgi:hypothetical protein
LVSCYWDSTCSNALGAAPVRLIDPSHHSSVCNLMYDSERHFIYFCTHYVDLTELLAIIKIIID